MARGMVSERHRLSTPGTAKNSKRARRKARERLRQQALHEQALRDDVSKFFAEARTEVQGVPGGIAVAGTRFAFSSADVERQDDLEVVDRIVAEVFLDRLLQTTVAQLSGHGFRLRALKGRHVVYIVHLHDPKQIVAVITGTRATVKGSSKLVLGNFLVGGSHWTRVRDRLPEPTHAHPAHEPKPSPAQSALHTLTELPAVLRDDQRSAALAASNRIRTERSLEFGQTVVLRLIDGFVRFAPIAEDGHATGVPFVYRRDHQGLRGTLRLRTPTGPLALVVTNDLPDQITVGDAWLAALLGYAELTCVPQGASVPDARDRTSTTASTAPRLARPSPPTHPHTGPELTSRSTHRFRLSTALKPTAPTRTLLASYVVGHRRLLPVGRRPSSDARRRAQSVGIVLGERETWVRPHARGVPARAELVFDWHTELSAS